MWDKILEYVTSFLGGATLIAITLWMGKQWIKSVLESITGLKEELRLTQKEMKEIRSALNRVGDHLVKLSLQLNETKTWFTEKFTKLVFEHSAKLAETREKCESAYQQTQVLKETVEKLSDTTSKLIQVGHRLNNKDLKLETEIIELRKDVLLVRTKKGE